MSTPPPRPGDPVAEHLFTNLLSCVCATLRDAGRGACRCMWYRGERRPPMEFCDATSDEGQGVAWARLVQRSNIQADQAQGRIVHFGAGDCPPGGIQQWTIEIGVYRCLIDRPEGRTAQEQTDAAANGAWDDYLLWKAVSCCDIDQISIIPQTSTTAGPRGGCIGSVLTALANVPATYPADPAEPEPGLAVERAVRPPVARVNRAPGSGGSARHGWA